MNAVLEGMLRGVALDEASSTPLYIQLQNVLRGSIRDGAFEPDQALPSERDMAAQLGISRVTVRKAITGLVEEGLLTQRWGSGTFIAPRLRVELPLSRLGSFTEDIRARGLKPATLCLHRAVGPVSPEEAMALDLSPGDPVSRLHRLRMADGLPLAIERATLPLRFLPDPAVVTVSLYEILEQAGHTPARALQRLRAVLVEEEQARLLQVPVGSAALFIERRAFLGDGTPLEFTRSHYRGDAYDFIAELQPARGQPRKAPSPLGSPSDPVPGAKKP